MRLTSAQARARFRSAEVARLATVAADGAPHLVPVVFALLDDATVVTSVDRKPKRSIELQRLRNIAAEPRVALLADGYFTDWSRLWWARADAMAIVLRDPGEPGFQRAIAALVARYPQYRAAAPSGPVVLAQVTRWSGWSAT